MEPTSMMSGSDIVSNVVPALMVVLGTPLAIWFWAKRGRSDGTAKLRITERAALGKGLWVAVVTVDERRYLVGAGEGSVRLIAELEPPAAEISQSSETQDADSANIDAQFASLTNGMTPGPRNGLIERLQHMTLRTPHRSTRPFHARRG